jgi:dolichyl-phosphate-mannose--protein O-mannosyl transferase
MKQLIGRIDTDPEVHASKNFPFMLQILCNGIRPFFAALMMDKVWRYTYTTAEQFLAIYLGQIESIGLNSTETTYKKCGVCSFLQLIAANQNTSHLFDVRSSCSQADVSTNSSGFVV